MTIPALHDGGSPRSGAIARKVVQRLHSTVAVPAKAAAPGTDTRLSPREQEVLNLLAEGRIYKEIADRLGIGFGTVRTHVRRIYEKLHARNRIEAMRKAASPPEIGTDRR